MKLLFKTRVERSLEAVKLGFNRELFLSLNPPWVEAKLERFDGCKANDEVHLELKQFGLRQKWKSRITDDRETAAAWWFVDEGTLLPWPLQTWRHVHRVEARGPAASEIIDDITYTTPSPVLDRLIYPALWMTFAVRPGRYKKFFSRNP